MISTPLSSSHLNTLRKALHLHPWAADVALALILFILTLATRPPIRSQTLHHWDSVSHALALDRYDVRIHQPQPPSYLRYMALGAVVNGILRDPQQSYAAYYLPEHPVLGLPGVRIEGNEGQFRTVYINCGREYAALRPPTQTNQLIPDSVRWVVSFDERALRWNLNDPHWEGINEKTQPVLSYRELSEGEELEFTLEGYEIISRKAGDQPPAPSTGGTGL